MPSDAGLRASGQHPRDAPMPRQVAPMLAKKGKLPEGPGWAFEFKWDGVRAIARVEGGRLRLDSRNLRDITERYPEVQGLAQALGGRDAILDGEVVALDDAGRPDFGLLQERMHLTPQKVPARLASNPVVYMVFDLLWLDGASLMDQPYEARRAALQGLALDGPAWQVPNHHVGHGAEVREASEAMGLEGVVAKRLDGPYLPGARSESWVKARNPHGQEFVVAGWSRGAPGRAGGIGSLLVGTYDQDGALRYAGRVGTGFTDAMLADLASRLRPLVREESPFSPEDEVPADDVTFVEPRLVCEVHFVEWTRHGTLRQPSFKGLREDKDPRAVVREDAPEEGAEEDG